jgi:hypothetical protein
LSVYTPKRLIRRLIADLSKVRDIPDSRVEARLKKLIFQTARYLLIANNKIPLSRWELADQVRQYSPRLSEQLKAFENKQTKAREDLLNLFYDFKAFYNDELRNL